MRQKGLWIALLIIALVVVAFFVTTEKNEGGYTVAVVTGTTFEKEARQFPGVSQVKLYEDDNQTLTELANGRVDAVITDRLVALTGIKKGGYENLKLAGDLLYYETIAVALGKGNDALRQAINTALKEIIADGTYEKISRKYFDADILQGVERTITSPGEPGAADDSWEKAKKRGVLSFAMSGGYPPFNYYNEKNELTGFDVEIAQAVCDRLGVRYEPVTTAWDGIIEGLRAGRYDGVWGSMAITEERQKIVDFTDPYYVSGAQLVVRKDSPITGAESLR
ncbi:MAG TPA: transporter substrate-binding domain-containing protein [Candidatus Mcinerneyibacteriales bacterium]|nr:transporter substrate-binding domain-containing protein [Candidatus Mcinerneyibacteriales bacterium]